MTPNTVLVNVVAEEVFVAAKGSYQRGLLNGYYRWSGADLAGRARKWSAKYAKSRRTLIDRLSKQGFSVKFGRAEHNRIFVTISR